MFNSESDIYGRRRERKRIVRGPACMRCKAATQPGHAKRLPHLAESDAGHMADSARAVSPVLSTRTARFDANLNKVGDEINSTGFGEPATRIGLQPHRGRYVFVFENTSYGPPG